MFTSRCLKLIIACLCSSLLLSSVPANLGNEVNADTWFSFEDQTPFGDKVYRSVEDCSYSVEVRNVSSWSGHANIEFKITNTGSSTIHDWRLTFDYGYSIENPFNCYIIEHQDNLYTFGNNNWNQDIKPGQSVTVGFTAASSNGSSISDTPSFYLLNTKTVTLSSSDLSYRFEQYSDWGAGYNGALIFTNNSGEPLRDWSVTFNSNRPITQIDSAVLTTNSDGTYTITNDGNNQNIGNGQTYRVGVQGGSHDSSVAFELNNYSAYAKKLAYSLSDDTNGNGVLDVLEIDAGGFFQIVTPTPEISATPTPEISDTPTPLITEIPDDIDYDTDTDEDLIPDDLEDYYGTDKNDPDTDNDGLLDGYELMAELDPTDPDTDGDGINDGDEDSDGDGLTNSQECEIGCNPMSNDTDMDDLTDFDEVYTYGTSPSDADTDGDKLFDSDELRLGLNPLSSDSDGNGIPDTDEKILQSKTVELTDSTHPSGVNSVTVKAEISGCMDHNTRIEDVYFEGCVSSMIDGAIGVPVDISTKGDFEEAELIFDYDEDELGDSQAQDLVICWIDYDNGEIVPLDSTIDEANHTVSATTTHFSQYVLLDIRALRKMWRENIAKALEYQGDRPVSQNNAFVVAIQMSDDLTQEQKQQEYDMVQAMLENLRPSDCITLIGYGGNENGFYAPLPHGITDIVRGDQEEAKEELLNEAYRWLFNYHDQPTNHSTSIHWVFMTVENFCTHEFAGDAYNKQFVFVTNGNAGDLPSASYYSQVQGDKYNYDMSVVMLGNTDVSIMADCYIYTGGSGIQLSDPDVEPEDVITILYERLDYGDLWKDEDGDGIPDIIESFPILTSFGYFVTVDPTKWSTDSDLLSDGKELIKQVFIYDYIYKFFYYSLGSNDMDYKFVSENEYKLKYNSVCYIMMSDPTLSDWDQDNANDDNDATVAKPNGPINYVVFDLVNSLTRDTAKAYIDYFEKNNYTYQAIPIISDTQFYYFFKFLEYGFEPIKYYDGFYNGREEYDVSNPDGLNKLYGSQYSYVENIILVFHGCIGGMTIEQVDKDSAGFAVNANEFSSSLVNCSSIEIKTIDCQSCFAGSYNSENKSVACELLKNTNVQEVYAATGEVIYNSKNDKNSIFLGKYYKFTINDENEIIRGGGKGVYDVMYRFQGKGWPYVVLDDYPSW